MLPLLEECGCLLPPNDRLEACPATVWHMHLSCERETVHKRISSNRVGHRLTGVLLGCLWLSLPGVVVAQADTSNVAAPVAVRSKPRYPQSTPIPEDMIRRRPRQVIALPSEPAEYGQDRLELSSGVIGKLPADARRLPEGHIIAGQQMSVEVQSHWVVCYLPDERLTELPLSQANSWANDLDARRLASGLVRAAQKNGITLTPESSVSVEEPGRRWRVGDSQRTFIVEREPDGMAVRFALPLRVLPNKRLAMLEAVLRGSDSTSSFVFTGPVTEFQGHNYILTEHLAEVVDVTPQSPAQDVPDTELPPPVDEPSSDSPPPPPAEPRPEDIIKQLLESRPRRAIALPDQPAAPQVEHKPLIPGAQADTGAELLWPEETIISDRPGRVVPTDQWWTFAFEDRGQQPTRKPIRLLPNRMLENAIALTGDTSRGVVLIVSGEVTEYRGNNYLLLRKVLVRRDWGNLR